MRSAPRAILCILFNDAKNNANYDARVRHAFEYTLDGMLDKYRSTEMSEMQSLIKRLENATMNLFAFIEHETSHLQTMQSSVHYGMLWFAVR